MAQWRGVEGVQTSKRWVAVCIAHGAPLDEGRTMCARGCQIPNVDSDDADHLPYRVVEESKLGAPHRPPTTEEDVMPSGIYERKSTPGTSTNKPTGGGRTSKIMERQEFHSESGNKLYLSLERDRSVGYVIRVRRKLSSGESDKGRLAAHRDEGTARGAYNEQVAAAQEKSWILGRHEGGLTEIPDADAADVAREKQTRRKRAA